MISKEKNNKNFQETVKNDLKLLSRNRQKSRMEHLKINAEKVCAIVHTAHCLLYLGWKQNK